jgi:hydroxyproline transport system permease protein
MSWWDDLTAIVFPIALRVGLPAWTGLALGLMKDSSLVLWIGVIELLRSSQIVVTRTQEPLLVLAIAGAIYFAISFPIGRAGAWLERRWQDQ